MEKNKYQITLFGGSFTQMLFIAFLVLKLCGVIAWSWWWVTSPLWLPVAVVLGILIAIAIGAAAVMLLTFLWAVISDMIRKIRY